MSYLDTKLMETGKLKNSSDVEEKILPENLKNN